MLADLRGHDVENVVEPRDCPKARPDRVHENGETGAYPSRAFGDAPVWHASLRLGWVGRERSARFRVERVTDSDGSAERSAPFPCRTGRRLGWVRRAVPVSNGSRATHADHRLKSEKLEWFCSWCSTVFRRARWHLLAG
nr:MAG: hypothetical protein DIU78_09495 [Pseudomonadota bacterium]